MYNHANESKKPLIILTGPTAVGKTDISIQLAKKVNGEIISADSMQVYRHMDIGTAKIKPEEMDGIPHHLIDILEPTDDFNVFLFQKLAKQAMKKIYDSGRIPIIVGGTGFYIQSVLYDIDFNESPDNKSKDNESHNRGTLNNEFHNDTFNDMSCKNNFSMNNSYRDELTRYYEENGAFKLHEKLKSIDPVSYETIHMNNVKRVIRALEFYNENGYPISKHNMEQRQKQSPYNFAYFVLNQNRQLLYDRIEQRIDIMISNGLIDEVRDLLESGCTKDMVSMQGLGYKEIIPYLNGECSLEDAVYILKRDTRHFAKRQFTWFNRERDVIMVDKDKLNTTGEQLDYMLSQCRKRNIIIPERKERYKYE